MGALEIVIHYSWSLIEENEARTIQPQSPKLSSNSGAFHIQIISDSVDVNDLESR